MSDASRLHDAVEDAIERMDSADTFAAMREFVRQGKPERDFERWLYFHIEAQQLDNRLEDAA